MKERKNCFKKRKLKKENCFLLYKELRLRLACSHLNKARTIKSALAKASCRQDKKS